MSDYFKSKNRFILHPSEASNYSRESIYTKLKFDNKIFSTGSKKTFINTENIGINMGDKSVYDNILYHLDNNKSQFFSVITMQNHAPWSVGSPAEVVATGEDFSPIENENITEYARLLTYTDSSTKEFLDNLSKIEKNVTVVFYGDHLPGLYPDSTFKNDSTQKYKTDYFIWSNHNSKQLNYPLVNSSDFIAELFEHTESKVSPYYALLTKILKEASVDKVNLDTQQAEIAEDLKLVQYDITLGENYLKDQHFLK
ncbi:sulfatase-like hydrolase/transferase [Streptococcus didelphis]|uniref:sulfatase-like hydrolase/transferase n=1 Tax=Streptococcus didelphis TaxID=102886 RepID=UPI0027D27587|nr:sulfatase-like hydrolase/transferase [Streptococcus didelphis]